MAEYLIQDTSLKYIAAAIREKAGVSKDMSPKEIAEQIYLLETPTDTGYPEKGVIFYDYDGTVLYSYTIKQARALTELPAGPTHDGVTFVGWTHTLEEINSAFKILYVGATYHSDSTQLTIDLSLNYPSGNRTVGLYFRQSNPGSTQIDWGDGSAVQTLSAGSLSVAAGISHTYGTDNDIYTIKLTTSVGKIAFFGVNSQETIMYGVFGDYMPDPAYPAQTGVRNDILIKAVIGDNLSMRDAIWDSTSRIGGQRQFFECRKLKSVIISHGMTTLPSEIFHACSSLSFLVIPNSVTMLYYTFGSSRGPTTMVLPNSVTYIDFEFYNCDAVSVVLPSGLTGLRSCFNNCSELRDVHFRSLTPPSIIGESFKYSSSSLKLYVPAISYDLYNEASGFSKFNLFREPV